MQYQNYRETIKVVLVQIVPCVLKVIYSIFCIVLSYNQYAWFLVIYILNLTLA